MTDRQAPVVDEAVVETGFGVCSRMCLCACVTSALDLSVRASKPLPNEIESRKFVRCEFVRAHCAIRICARANISSRAAWVSASQPKLGLYAAFPEFVLGWQYIFYPFRSNRDLINERLDGCAVLVQFRCRTCLTSIITALK